MVSMNENSVVIQLSHFMISDEGWGRAQGRETYHKLIEYIEQNPGVMIFKISLESISRVDISFSSETIIEIARRYRCHKGFCFMDLTDADMLENWEAAAERKNQPLMVWTNNNCSLIGPKPSPGNIKAFEFALKRLETRASDFVAEFPDISITNASTKFKQLWEGGFLLRREENSESGGVVFLYYRIG